MFHPRPDFNREIARAYRTWTVQSDQALLAVLHNLAGDLVLDMDSWVAYLIFMEEEQNLA
jgi:hypothetical protein